MAILGRDYKNPLLSQGIQRIFDKGSIINNDSATVAGATITDALDQLLILITTAMVPSVFKANVKEIRMEPVATLTDGDTLGDSSTGNSYTYDTSIGNLIDDDGVNYLRPFDLPVKVTGTHPGPAPFTCSIDILIDNVAYATFTGTGATLPLCMENLRSNINADASLIATRVGNEVSIYIDPLSVNAYKGLSTINDTDLDITTANGIWRNVGQFLMSTLAQTASNKTFLTSCEFADSVTSTKRLAIDLLGATAATKATLDFNQTVDRTYTFPDDSGTMMMDSGGGLATQIPVYSSATKATSYTALTYSAGVLGVGVSGGSTGSLNLIHTTGGKYSKITAGGTVDCEFILPTTQNIVAGHTLVSSGGGGTQQLAWSTNPIISGTGTNTRVALWTGTNSIGDNALFAFNGASVLVGSAPNPMGIATLYDVYVGRNIDSYNGLVISNYNAGVSSRAMISCFSSDNGVNASGIDIVSYSAASTVHPIWGGGAAAIIAEALSTSLTLCTNAAIPINFAINDVIKMRLDGTGQLGLGTGVTALSYQFTSNYTTAGTNAVNSSFLLKTTSSGNMADGFGGGMLWGIEDNAAVENLIAGISAYRSGADNTGTLAFRVNNAGTFNYLMYLNNLGYLGLGVTPTSSLQVGTPISTESVGAGYYNFTAPDFAQLSVGAYGSNALNCPTYSFLRTRGTAASPTQIVNGDRIGDILFQAQGSGGRAYAARILALSNGTVGASNVATDLLFYTATDLAFAERMRITSAGYVGINTTTLSTQFQINDNPTSGITGSQCFVISGNDGAVISVNGCSNTATAGYEPGFQFYRTGGTIASTTNVVTNSYLGSITWNGKIAAGRTPGASISAQVTGAVDPNLTTDLIFSTKATTSNTEKMRITGAGLVGIGMTPSEILDIKKDQNAVTTVQVTNSTSGTGSTARFQAVSSAGTTVNLQMRSATTTTYGMAVQNDAGIYTNSSVGFFIMADSANAYIGFATGGNTEKARIASTGELLVGHTTSFGANYKMQSYQTASNCYNYIASFSTTASSEPGLVFLHSKSNTIGTLAATDINTICGSIAGVSITSANAAAVGASIVFKQTAAAAATANATDILFSTSAGGVANAEKMRLTSVGDLQMLQDNEVSWMATAGGTLMAGVYYDSATDTIQLAIY